MIWEIRCILAFTCWALFFLMFVNYQFFFWRRWRIFGCLETSFTVAFSRLCWTPAHEEEQHDAGGHEGSYHPCPHCLRLFVANRQLVFILLRVGDTGMTRKVGKTKDFRFCDADQEPAERQVQHGRWRKENNFFLTSTGVPLHNTQLIFNNDWCTRVNIWTLLTQNETQGRVLCVFIRV